MKPAVTILLLTLVSILISGCGSSSPRYATNEKPPSGERPEKKTSARFSSEAEEERKEDDKKVEPTEIERIKAGTRDFRREKNTSIKPLDQSRMMREISKYMGVPYELGGSDEKGMDCSGYTMVVYKNAVGKSLPRSASEQSKTGVPVDLKDLKFGDLIFFNTTGTSASHVGIYLGDDLFAHASVSLGVTISSLESTYYKSRYDGARRVIE
ncbi:MAG TPA: NlpC/P60 family protein [Bacteroidota bacterium]|nr:NlpC/P60 family protein [Bacteroidota bacterium]